MMKMIKQMPVEVCGNLNTLLLFWMECCLSQIIGIFFNSRLNSFTIAYLLVCCQAQCHCNNHHHMHLLPCCSVLELETKNIFQLFLNSLFSFFFI